MDNLVKILQREMTSYATEGENGYAYLTRSINGDVFTIVYVWEENGKTEVDTGLLVRIIANTIYIMRDQNDKLLVDALIQAGISREQIILVYDGEKLEETA